MVIEAADKIDGGLPSALYSMMMVNLAIEYGLGLVPFIGDMIGVFYKANSRNALLLEKYLYERGAENMKKQTHMQNEISKIPDDNDASARSWFRWKSTNNDDANRISMNDLRQNL